MVSTPTHREADAPQLHGDRGSCMWGPLDLALYTYSSSYFSYLVFNKPVNISVSLSTMSHSSKLLYSRRWSWEPQFKADWLKIQVTTWDLRLES